MENKLDKGDLLNSPEEKTSSTIAPKQIDTFNDYKGNWWDANGPLKPLHELNPLRLQFIKEQILAIKNIDQNKNLPYDGLDMIDVGCGAGLITEPLVRLGGSVTGIDASDTALTQARTHAIEHSLDINYELTTIEKKCEQDQLYDVVMALEVVEHVDNVDLFLTSCAKLLKPGGILFVSTLNRTAVSYIKSILIAEYLLRWIPQGTHDWNRFLKPSELAVPLQRESCYFTRLQGIDYNIIKRSWELNDSLNTNYIGCAIKR